MANWVAWGVPCILKSLSGMIERERTSRNRRGVLYCAVSLWFESWLHSVILGNAHSQAEGPFSCRDTSCWWEKGYHWRLLASTHKNEVSIVEDFIDLKTRKNEVVDLGLVWQLNNIIKTQALSIILFFLPQKCHVMVAKWLLPQCQPSYLHPTAFMTEAWNHTCLTLCMSHGEIHLIQVPERYDFQDSPPVLEVWQD